MTAIIENILQVQKDKDGYRLLFTHKDHGVMTYRATADDETELGQELWQRCEDMGLSVLPEEYQQAADAARTERSKRLLELNLKGAEILETLGEEDFLQFEIDTEPYRRALADLPYSQAWPNVEFPDKPEQLTGE